MFKGVYTALITPFSHDGKIDFKAMERVIEANIKAGVDGFVLLGTTAETPALEKQEKLDILKAATSVIGKRAQIIIGAGSNSTKTTLETMESYLPFNPAAFLVVTPYYNKPNPSGLIMHYVAASSVGKPVILYHIPGRTGLKVAPKLLEEIISASPMVKGIKESDYDISHVTESAVRLSNKIDILCGNDDLFLQHLSLGASGIISAAGNCLAPVFVGLQKTRDMNLFRRAYNAIGACYYETNPTCVKYFLSKLGLCGDGVRLPLGPISTETIKKLDEVLAKTDRELFV